MACYDFPEIVIHEMKGNCPRYNGGICHPLPTPVPPYTPEEEEIVQSYKDFMAGRIPIRQFLKPTGTTQYPEKETKA